MPISALTIPGISLIFGVVLLILIIGIVYSISARKRTVAESAGIKVGDKQTQKCNRCDANVPNGSGYVFFCDMNLSKQNIPYVPGSKLLCKSCTDKIMSYSYWQYLMEKYKTMEDFDQLKIGEGALEAMDMGIIGHVRLILTPEEAKKIAKEFAETYWKHENIVRAEKRVRAAWKSVIKKIAQSPDTEMRVMNAWELAMNEMRLPVKDGITHIDFIDTDAKITNFHGEEDNKIKKILSETEDGRWYLREFPYIADLYNEVNEGKIGVLGTYTELWPNLLTRYGFEFKYTLEDKNDLKQIIVKADPGLHLVAEISYEGRIDPYLKYISMEKLWDEYGEMVCGVWRSPTYIRNPIALHFVSPFRAALVIVASSPAGSEMWNRILQV